MSVDTGAGTPLTAEEKIAGLDAWAASDAPDEEWAGVRKDTWRLARSRPATDPAGLSDYQRGYVDGFDAPANVTARSRPAPDPAGLDADRLAIALKQADDTQGLNGYREWAERIAHEYARLSVADGSSR